MTWTDDYYYMMLRVLTINKCHPVAEWMGLGPICFAEDMHTYDQRSVTIHSPTMRTDSEHRGSAGMVGSYTPVAKQLSGRNQHCGPRNPIGPLKLMVVHSPT